jgi:hypothetical protein
MLPQTVRKAQQCGDYITLSRSGHAGGVASGKVSRRRREEREVFADHIAERRKQEERELRESTNEHEYPVD